MIRYIMFDMGDTLITIEKFDFDKAFLETFKLLKDKNVKFEDYLLTAKRIFNDTLNKRDTFDVKCVDVFSLLETFFGKHLKSLDELEDIFSNIFMIYSEEQGVRKVLEEYQKQNIKMLVLSNTFFSSRCIRNILTKLDLSKCFVDIIASSDNLVRKPSSLFFEVGIKKFNCAKEEVIYIGNSYEFDYLGSKGAGIKVIYYNRKQEKHVIDDICYEISSYKQLLGKDINEIF